MNSSTSGGVGCGSEWRGAANSSGGVGCGSEWRGAANSSGFDRIPVRVGRGSQEHVRKNKFAQVSKLVYDCAADHKQVITNLAKLHACKKKNRHAKKTDTAQEAEPHAQDSCAEGQWRPSRRSTREQRRVARTRTRTSALSQLTTGWECTCGCSDRAERNVSWCSGGTRWPCAARGDVVRR